MLEEQAEGVTQDVGTPQTDVQDSTPESIETGETQPQEGDSLPEGDQPKSKEYNFKQMRENVSRLEASLEKERKAWLEEKEGLRNAAQLDRALRQDPRGGLKYIAQQFGVDLKTLIEASQPAQNDLPQINFEQYEAGTAKDLKLLHDEIQGLRQWKTQFEQKIDTTQKQAHEEKIQQNMTSLEDSLNTKLVKDGYLDKNGNGNESLIETISDAVYAKLAKIGDPRLATPEQLQEAYSRSIAGLSAHQKETLKKTVKTDVPLSGSRKGSIPFGKAKMTEEERISSIVNSLEG